MTDDKKIKVSLVDDHVLLRNGLASLVNSFDGYTVVFEADNGNDFINKIKQKGEPDIALLDINMPKMDGYETSAWLKQNYPLVKILALSMYDNENAIIRMFKEGTRGYILKDCEPPELKAALDAVVKTGYYYSSLVTNKLVNSINKLVYNENTIVNNLRLNDKEISFLKLACTEMTYKEIADKMFLSPRTIDGYRDALFEKLGVTSRVGLVLYAIKNGIVVV